MRCWSSLRPRASMGAVVLIGAAVGSACIESRAYDRDTAVDAAVDAPSGCLSMPQICAEPDTNCLDDLCRDCDQPGTQDSDCTSRAEPICGADHDCRPCAVHEECASGVCFGGVCPAGVLYVDAVVGDDGGGNLCTDSAAPCHTLTRALGLVPPISGDPATNRRFVRLVSPGIYVEPSIVTVDGKAVVIVGPPAAGGRAVLERSGNGPTLLIQNGADVRLERIAVNDGVNNAAADGVTCTSSTLAAVGIEVDNNNGTGIEADTCELAVTNSVISRNHEGGISVVRGRAVLVNNTVVANGGAGSTFGGLWLASSVASTTVIQSNTIVNNASAGATDSDGIDCRITGVIARNNIVFGNATKPRANGACAHHNTLYGPTDVGTPALGSANGNLRVPAEADFKFTNASARNYRLRIETPPSVARDKGSTTGLAPEAMTDLDGEPRPQGLPDVGADEIP